MRASSLERQRKHRETALVFKDFNLVTEANLLLYVTKENVEKPAPRMGNELTPSQCM